MQPLLDGPRAGLTADIVTGLIALSPSVTIAYGADILSQVDLSVVGDLTPYMSDGSTLGRSNYATVHGTCSLNYDNNAPFNSLNQLVRPWQKLTDNDTGVSALFNLGVYTLTSPQKDISILPSVISADGFDQLYFLDNPLGDSLEFLAGTNPIDDAIALLQIALDGTAPIVQSVATSAVLASNRTYAYDGTNSTTYLTAINDLLSTAGYQGLWVDWNGVFQMLPYITPKTRAPEYTFTLSGLGTIVAETRSITQDMWSVPNYWRYVMNNVEGTPVEGVNQYTFTNDDPASPSSTVNRLHTYRSVNYVDAADYATLVSVANQGISATSSPQATIDNSTFPFPLAWHFDQAVLLDANVEGGGSGVRVQAQSWTQALDGTSDTTWVWEVLQ